MLKRLVLVALAIVVVLIVVAAGSAYWFFARDGFRQALEAQATSWLGHPVRIGAARAQFLPRLAVGLKDVRVGEPAQLVLDDVDLASDLRPLFNGRIENADVRISGSRIDMPLPFGLPQNSDGGEATSGPLGTPDKARPTSDSPVRIVSVRSIALRSVRIRSRGRELVVSADSSFDGKALTLERFTAEAGGTRLAAEGAVALTPRIDARLKATANRLDVDELLALAAAFGPASSGSTGPAAFDSARARKAGPNVRSGQSARISASISADQVTAGGLQLQRFTTTLVRDGDSIALNPSQFEVFGGRYEGSIVARLGRQLSATLDARLENVDVAKLAAYGGAADTITGTLSGTGTFSGSGSDVAQVLHNVRGNGSAAIVNGSIRRLHFVRTVILFFGRPAPDAGESTDRFDRLDARFSLANRVLNADALSLHSPDADTVGAGTLNLDSEALDGRLNITLSEALSAQAGTDLIRFTREGNRVVLPAAIGGTLSTPRLTIDVAAAAKRGLQNEVERRLKGLLDGFGR